MQWIIFAFLTAGSYGLFNFFMKLSGAKFSPTLANIFIAGTSLIIAVISTLYLKFTGHGLIFTKENIKLPILAGVFTAVGEIFYLTMYSKQAPMVIAYPIVGGGALLIVLLLGLFILKEPVTLFKIIGIICIIAGIIFVSRD